MNNKLKMKKLEFYRFLLNGIEGFDIPGKPIDMFDIQIDNFNKYIENCLKSNLCRQLYINRKGLNIEYGKYRNSTKIDKNNIVMQSEDDLKNICLKLQEKYGSKFRMYSNIVDGYGCTLNMVINNNVLIKVNSDDILDRKWFLNVESTTSFNKQDKAIKSIR